MRFKSLAVLGATLGLAVAPGLAMGAAPDTTPGLAHVPADSPAVAHIPATPGAPAGAATLPDQAKGYGHRCKGESKKRSDAAPGTKGSPFSQCVKAAAQAAKQSS